MTNKNHTDVSISDISRIRYDDIDKKLNRLAFYIQRVHQRLSVIHRQFPSSTEKKAKTYIDQSVDESAIRTTL